MTGSHEVLEHTADVGIRARGAGPREVYAQAALGLMGLLCEPETVAAREEEAVEVSGADAVELLVTWLQEVLFRFDAHRMVWAEVAVTEFAAWRLAAVLRGEPLDTDRHELNMEIKAVTWHGARMERENGGWVAEVYLDI